MALTVEDGTGLANAESYISVTDADTYHTNRGNTGWTGADSVKEAALRKATDYMIQVYRLRWKGAPINDTMALDWPREEVPKAGMNEAYFWPEDEVPLRVTYACAELALRALSADLAPDITRLTKREKVDVIEVEYFEGQPATDVYQAVDKMLAEFLNGPQIWARVRRT